MHRSLYFLFLTLQTDEYIFKDMSLFQTSKIFQQIYFTLRHRLLHALLSLLCRLVHSGYGKLHASASAVEQATLGTLGTLRAALSLGKCSSKILR